MAEFITLGEPLVVLASKEKDVELERVETFQKFVAGAELNVTLGLSRLEHETMYISTVGNDPFGRFIIEETKKSGINTSYLKVDSKFLTGFYLKQNVSTGDPKVAYFRKNSAAANMCDEDINSIDLTRIKLGHLSGIFPALSPSALKVFKTFNKRLNDAHILTVFDPNLRPALWDSKKEMIDVINDLSKMSQIVLPGINEGEILMGSRNPEKIANFYLDQSEMTTSVVVKLGADGAYLKTKGENGQFIKGFKVSNVVDTVGAGDGFAVGLESSLLEGWPIEDAVRRACAVGAMAIQSAGDNDGYPTREALIKFINENSSRGNFAC